MAPPTLCRRQRRRAPCQICEEAESKYTCAKCAVLYCSVSCYKQHKSSVCIDAEAPPPPAPPAPRSAPTSPRTAHANPPLPLPPHSPPLASALAGDSDRCSIAPDARVPAASISRGGSIRSRGSSSSSNAAAAQDDPPLAGPSASNASSASSAGPTPLAASSEPNPNPNSNPDTANAPETPRSGVTGSSSGEIAFADEEDAVRSHAATVRQLSPDGPTALADPRPLRKLTTLHWPYVPDEPSFPDPLKRDDPKPLSLAQYEAIATSPSIRHALSAHPRLPALLTSLDQLRGAAREDALERVLGVAPAQSSGFALAGLPSSSSFSFSMSSSSFSTSRPDIDMHMHSEEDMRALRALAEAVEGAVRGERADVLGLDWEAMAG